MLVFALPNGFPNHADAALQGERFSFRKYFNETLHRVDFVGCFVIETGCKFLFADLSPKEFVSRGRERRELRRAEEERLKALAVEEKKSQ